MKKQLFNIMAIALIAICAAVSPAEASRSDDWTVECNSTKGFSAEWARTYQVDGYEITFHALNQFSTEEDAPKMDKFLATFAGKPVEGGVGKLTKNFWLIVKPDGSADLELAFNNAKGNHWPYAMKEMAAMAMATEKVVRDNNLIALHKNIRAEYNQIVASNKCQYTGSFKRP
jgi:hypothetical protein